MSNRSIVIIENHILATLSIRKKLLEALLNKGFDVTILATGTSVQLETARTLGCKVIDVQSCGNDIFQVFKYGISIWRAIRKSKPSVCLTFTIRPAIIGNLITRLLSVYTITNITGVGPLFQSNKPTYKFARGLYKYALHKTKKVFFQNNDDRALFLKNNFVAAEKTALIPGSGIDHEFFKPVDYPYNKDKFSFLYIGRLLKDKGILEFIEAATQIKKEFADIEIIVVGPLWQQNLKENTITEHQLRSWIEEGTITYFGEVLDVRQFIAAADCMVLPSYREGTSNVLLEASSMERPCITTDTTGCREIVEDNVTGFLCKVADANDLYIKMKKMFLLSAEARIQMGKNARIKVKREFDKKIVIDAYLNAINCIV